MADVSVSLDLDAQQLYQELQNVQSHFAQFASKTVAQGEKASKGFLSGFKNAFSGAGVQSALSSLSGVLGPLAGIFTVAGIEQAIKGTVEYGTQIEDLSRRFGVASETIQRFGNAAELNGSSLEAVAKGFRFLEVSQAKAIGGNDAMIKSFAGLGVSINDLKSLRPEEIALKIGKSSLNAADFVKVFGKSALELRPLLAGLADGTIEFGHAISNIDTERLKEANDFFQKMGQNVKIAAATVLAELLPAIGRLQDIAQGPAEAITRAFDKTPTGASASPEDTALAAQIHASREAAAGGPLPTELAPRDADKAAKKRRDLGDPAVIEKDESSAEKDAQKDREKAADEREKNILKLGGGAGHGTGGAAGGTGAIGQSTLQDEIAKAQKRVSDLETPQERVADWRAGQQKATDDYYTKQKDDQEAYRLTRPDLISEKERTTGLAEAKERLSTLQEGAVAGEKEQKIRSEPIEQLLKDIKENTEGMGANK